MELQFVEPKEKSESFESIYAASREPKPVQNKPAARQHEYTFENFVEGSSNKLAYAACYAVASIAGDVNYDHVNDVYNRLCIYGASGLGKTHLSNAVARGVIEKGCDVYYTGAIDLISTFEVERFKSYSNEPNPLIERYFESDLLIIDDLGTEIINQFSVSTVYNLINDRLSRKKPTIISTNLSGDEIKQKYTDRITSRLLGEYMVCFFMGTDVRAQKLRNS
jgi:DNA replication protein DnaC